MPVFTQPTLRAIYEELTQVQEEFDTLSFDFKENRLSIETEPVELENIYLGPFQIELHLKSLWQHTTHGSYRVIAQDPHPASGNEDVTHPHVNANRLCEGDGPAAITMALASGRLFDFFSLVANILKTYNSSSAYVRLDDWIGRDCYECGSRMSDDEVYYCQFCSSEFCEDCSSSCRVCETSACTNCLETCICCDERVCKDCLKVCRECGGLYCTSCMDQSERICPNCKESEEYSDDSINENDEDGTERETNPAPTTPGTESKEEPRDVSLAIRI
jgi:hypothetical protein